jgi:hypothetical protein
LPVEEQENLLFGKGKSARHLIELLRSAPSLMVREDRFFLNDAVGPEQCGRRRVGRNRARRGPSRDFRGLDRPAGLNSR